MYADPPSLIYGLEKKARTLIADQSDTDNIKFIIGTESINSINEIHLISVDEWCEGVQGTVVPFNGEVIDLSSDPNGLIAVTSKNRGVFTSSAYRQLEGSLKLEATMAKGPEEIKSAQLEGLRCLNVLQSQFEVVDVSTESRVFHEKQNLPYCGNWVSPNSVLVGGDGFVKFVDLRTDKKTVLMEEERVVLSVEANPNIPHVILSAGDDCRLVLRDLRNPSVPLVELKQHTHWVWKAKFNKFHDQLVVSAGSDGLVLLNNVVSVCSDFVLGDSQEIDMSCDCLLRTYQEHEESVYSVDWSAADPWMFASLSYDGRLAIYRLPDHVKLGLI